MFKHIKYRYLSMCERKEWDDETNLEKNKHTCGHAYIGYEL